MAKPLGLTTRGNSHQLRIVIPKDLREAYGGRSDFRISLGQMDRREAQARAHALRAEKEAEFQIRRQQLTGQKVGRVTVELARAIGQRVYAKQLQNDDKLREDAPTMRALEELAGLRRKGLQGLMIGEPPSPSAPAFGLSEDAAQALAGLNSMLDAGSAIDLARRNLGAALPAAEAAARELGLVIDWTTDDGRAALKEALHQYRAAMQARSRRDQGEAVETPAVADLAPPKAKHTLRDVLPKWAAVKQPAKNTLGKVTYAVSLFEDKFPGLTLDKLTKAHGADFITYLLEKCTAQKTAKDHFNSVKALLNFARDHLGWLDETADPWKAHTVTVKKSRPRQPWSSESLAKLFGSPVFTAYALPSTANAGGAAAYWVPLLGLYTGARQSELCQLRTADVIDTADGLVLNIVSDAGDDDEESPETSTKTASSQRRVPVHSELIRLGFADYVQDMREAGQARLFPAVRFAPGRRAGEYFSDWFSEYRRACGVTKRYEDFHAFRHTSRTRLTDAGVEGLISSALMGHSEGGGTGRKVYDHSIMTLRPNLERLAYPELQLPRVYPVRSK